MKFKILVFFICSSFSCLSQVNQDSLINILIKKANDSLVYTDLEKLYQTGIKNHELALKKERENETFSEQESSNKIWLEILLLIALLIAIGFIFSQKSKEKKYLSEQEKLTSQVELLKKQLTLHSVTTLNHEKKAFSLDKEKIEKAINSKLGESSWMILNLIFTNPSISNLEIAEQVSLSLEGVSSSLRRMYQTFEITSKSNKKITLIMKAARLSFEN